MNKFVKTAAFVAAGIVVAAGAAVAENKFGLVNKAKDKFGKKNEEGTAAAEALGVGTTAPTDQQNNNQGPKFGNQNPQPQKA